MTIIYPVSEPLKLRKASDARIMRMAASFARRGHKIHLLIAGRDGTRKEILDYYGIEDLSNLEITQIYSLRKNNSFGLSWNFVFYLFSLIKIRQLCMEERGDIIYLSILKLASFLNRWRRLIPAGRFIYELHDLGIYPEMTQPTHKNRKIDRLESEVLPHMDGIIVPTNMLAKVVKHRFPSLPVAAIPLGTTADGFKLNPYRFIIKDSYNLCYIGQLYPAQGVDILIRACASVESIHLHIIGGKEKEITELKSLVKEVGLENITFHGFVPPSQIWTLVSKMDILALPARFTVKMNYKAHIKIYEYLTYGRPIIATAMESTMEELRDGENAVLVKPDDVNSFADGIKRIINSPDLAQKIATGALEAAPIYLWDNRIVKIEEFLGKLS